MINGLVECSKMPKEHKFGTTRKYRRVLFLSIVTFGIYYIIYQYWLLQDFEEHHEKAFDTKSKWTSIIEKLLCADLGNDSGDELSSEASDTESIKMLQMIVMS